MEPSRRRWTASSITGSGTGNHSRGRTGCPKRSKALGLTKKISPTAWRHVHMNGHYTFRSNGPLIDRDAIVAGLDQRDGIFGGLGLQPLSGTTPFSHHPNFISLLGQRVASIDEAADEASSFFQL